MIRTTFLLLIIVSLLSNSIAKINCRRKCEWVCNGEDDDDNDYGENDSKGSGDSKEHKGSKRSGGAGGSTVSVGSSSSGGWSGFEEYGDSMKNSGAGGSSVSVGSSSSGGSSHSEEHKGSRRSGGAGGSSVSVGSSSSGGSSHSEEHKGSKRNLFRKQHRGCGKNQKWSHVSGCDPTCREPYGNRKCPIILRAGCVCQKGYVRTGKDGTGRCVPLGKCKHCPHHERRAFCRGHCQPTCKNPHPKCSLKCRRGCRCRLGYVRSRPGGPCIKKKHCKKHRHWK
ncbi:hypothetical protein SSS_10527 [Sarcoptes scabiei]|nr:hypothetical protein SSS_10527 [Sarcoptes scabiei]